MVVRKWQAITTEEKSKQSSFWPDFAQEDGTTVCSLTSLEVYRGLKMAEREQW